jgi:hypothetical protein
MVCDVYVCVRICIYGATYVYMELLMRYGVCACVGAMYEVYM